MPPMKKKQQVVIVGGGPVGMAMAIELAQRGITNAIVELRRTSAYDRAIHGIVCRAVGSVVREPSRHS